MQAFQPPQPINLCDPSCSSTPQVHPCLMSTHRLAETKTNCVKHKTYVSVYGKRQSMDLPYSLIIVVLMGFQLSFCRGVKNEIDLLRSKADGRW